MQKKESHTKYDYMSEIANIQEIIEDNPIITAVKDQDGLESCLQTDSGVVFILFGDI